MSDFKITEERFRFMAEHNLFDLTDLYNFAEKIESENEKLKQRCGEYHNLVDDRTMEKLKLESEKAELRHKYQDANCCSIVKNDIIKNNENKIKQLESEKAELIELLKHVPDYIFCKHQPCLYNDVQECVKCVHNPNILQKYEVKP